MESGARIPRRIVQQAQNGVHLVAVPSNAGYLGALALRLGPKHVLAQLQPPPEVVSHLPSALVDTGHVQHIAQYVAASVARHVAAHRLPIVLGGDHTVALGGVLGVRRGLERLHRREIPLFLLWLDAHPDVNTSETSPSGNLHGMALAGLLGQGPLAIEQPLPADQVVVAGVRAFDPGELAFLRAHPEIELWDVATLRGQRWRARAEALLERVRRARGRLYVSLDLDVLDPRHASGVAVPEADGALPTPLLALLHHLATSGLVAGADIVELYPPADVEGRTAAIAGQAVRALSAAHPSLAAQTA